MKEQEMSTLSISGTNKLAERIISDAEAEAQKTRTEANAAAEQIRAENERAVKALRASNAMKRESAVKSRVAGFQTRAALDGRKSALSKKRAVIDEAFQSAYRSLLRLDETRRARICEQLLLAEAEGGETVVPAKADRKGIERVLAGLKDKNLTLSSQDAPIEGGFLLLSKSYEKDCSFRSLMNEARQNEETSVAKMLFD
jgi:V/A-type H+/Na+-transporting ATPase subunit E